MKAKKILTITIFALTVLIVTIILSSYSDTTGIISNRLQAEDNLDNYEVAVIRLKGGDWGYPTPYAHYPRGPGGFKMCFIFDSLLA